MDLIVDGTVLDNPLHNIWKSVRAWFISFSVVCMPPKRRRHWYFYNGNVIYCLLS